MIAGIDFPSFFQIDNFAQRRANSKSTGNACDPEGLISGLELGKGLNFRNSSRFWRGYDHYLKAVSGKMTWDQILTSAPRVLLTPEQQRQRLVF